MQVKKKEGAFLKEEYKGLVVVSLTASFILTFRMWGEGSVFDFKTGFNNLLLYFLLILVSLFVRQMLHKKTALFLGYDSVYGFWPIGIFLTLFISILTAGYVPFFFTGYNEVSLIGRKHVGRFRSKFSKFDIGRMFTVGTLASLGIALISNMFLRISGWALFEILRNVNLLIAIFGLLPLELLALFAFVNPKGFMALRKSDGLNLIYASPVFYVFFLIFTLAYSALILMESSYAFWFSLVLGIIGAYSFNAAVMKK